MKKILICFTIAIPIVICVGLWIGDKKQSQKTPVTKTTHTNKVQKSSNEKTKTDSNNTSSTDSTNNNTNQNDNKITNSTITDNSYSNEQPISTESNNSENAKNSSETGDDGVARNAYGAPIDPARYVDPTDPSKGLRPDGETNPDFKATNPNATQWQDKYK